MYKLYRTTNSTNYVNELLKTFYPSWQNFDKIDNRKKKLIADQWSRYIIEFFLLTKLNK